MAGTIICCLNAGNYLGQGKKYVEILFDSVTRNLPEKQAFSFVCFTDDEEPYREGIIKRSLEPNLSGWWHKMALFKQGVFERGDRIIFFDLDTVITGPLDSLLTYDGPFAILKDFYRPLGLGPAVIMWTPTEDTEYIWQYFKLQWRMGIREDYIGPLGGRGDQAILEDVRRLTHKMQLNENGKLEERIWLNNPLQNLDFLQDRFPKAFRSYKVDCRFEIPKKCKVVCFHGLPRPHEITEGWMPNIWKVGGGSALELEIICNVSDDVLHQNIEHACGLPYENLADQYLKKYEGQRLVICGGGPSLADSLTDIAMRQKHGQIIWALNNTWAYLVAHGIMPDAHVMLDAREGNAAFVPLINPSHPPLLLYASQCHPQVFEKASGGQIIIWHSAVEGIDHLMVKLKRKVAFVYAGNSVGLQAFGLAQLFGFKYIHLFGYDSCYRDDKNHAYNQPLNDGENVIDVTVDKTKFRCAPWMATQGQQFQECLPTFISKGMEFSVHGEGLIRSIARAME